jgi:hypothetical protein
VLVSYSIVNETFADSLARPRELTHYVSVKPAVNLGDRLRLGAGLHAAFPRVQAHGALLAASIRPAVRLVGALEAALEAARRSAAPDGEALNAYRAELAYWIGEQTLGIALGYTIYGFSGTGLDPRTERSERAAAKGKSRIQPDAPRDTERSDAAGSERGGRRPRKKKKEEATRPVLDAVPPPEKSSPRVEKLDERRENAPATPRVSTAEVRERPPPAARPKRDHRAIRASQ